LIKTLDYECRDGITEVKTKYSHVLLPTERVEKKQTNFGSLPCNHKLTMVCFIQALGLIQGCTKPASKPVMLSFQSYAFGACVRAQFSVNMRNCVPPD